MILTFQVSAASLSEEYGESHETEMARIRGQSTDKLPPPVSTTRFILFLKIGDQIGVGENDRIEKESLGTLHLRPLPSYSRELSPIVGEMSFTPFEHRPTTLEACYHIGADLPPDQFTNLVAAARNGRIPTHITLNVDGLSFGTGSTLKWDVKANLPVTKFSANVELVHDQSWPSYFPEPSHLPLNKGHFLQFSEKMWLPTVSALDRKLNWLIWCIVVIGSLILLSKR